MARAKATFAIRARPSGHLKVELTGLKGTTDGTSQVVPEKWPASVRVASTPQLPGCY